MISRLNSGVMQVTGGAGALSLRSLMNTASAGKGDTAVSYKPNFIRMSFEGAVRYTLDGQTPTAAVGLMGIANATNEHEGVDLDKIIIIGAQKINIALGFKTAI